MSATSTLFVICFLCTFIACCFLYHSLRNKLLCSLSTVHLGIYIINVMCHHLPTFHTAICIFHSIGCNITDIKLYSEFQELEVLISNIFCLHKITVWMCICTALILILLQYMKNTTTAIICSIGYQSFISCTGICIIACYFHTFSQKQVSGSFVIC